MPGLAVLGAVGFFSFCRSSRPGFMTRLAFCRVVPGDTALGFDFGRGLLFMPFEIEPALLPELLLCDALLLLLFAISWSSLSSRRSG